MKHIGQSDLTDISKLSDALHIASTRLAALETISQDAMLCVQPNGTIDSWNPAAERMFGYDAKELLGQNVSVLAPADSPDEIMEFIARGSRGESLDQVETTRLRKDRTLVHVAVTALPLRAINGAILGVVVVMRDISLSKEWERHQKLMTRELSHRVKNSFAVLQAIMHSTLKVTPQPAEFAKVFSSRLHSLAAAQDILTANDWKSVELGALARHQLASYDKLDDVKLTITGPEIYLAPQFASPFGLIFNELAANAVKHGAWSSPFGKVELKWRVDHGEVGTSKLHISWKEQGGPQPPSHRPPGLGVVLIEKSLAGAQVVNSYETQGLTCTIELEISPQINAVKPKSRASLD